MSPRLHRTGCPCIGTDLEDLCGCTVPVLFTHEFDAGVLPPLRQWHIFEHWHHHPKLGDGVLHYMPDGRPRHLKPSRLRRILAAVSRWGDFGWQVVRHSFVTTSVAIVVSLLAADFMGGGR